MTTRKDNPSILNENYSVEWYTPLDLIEPMLGVLGLGDRKMYADPCTSEAALTYQRNGGIHAPSWHCMKNGQKEEWPDLPIWLNPPYGRGLLDWVNRYAAHTSSALLLCPPSVDVGWWHVAWNASDAVVFLKGRIKFVQPDGKPCSGNTKGSMLFLAARGSRSDNDLQKSLLEQWAKTHGHTYHLIRGTVA